MEKEVGYRDAFSTHETWLMLRKPYTNYDWVKCVWFSMSTPKYAFMTWLAMLDRMSTMDRVSIWDRSADATCVLCKNALETRNHLFFECSFSSQVWESLAIGILRSSYSTRWSDIVPLLCDGDRVRKRSFCIRYAFQSTLYAVWREINRIKHGQKPLLYLF